MRRSKQAAEQFKTGLNCAQAVLAAFADDLGIDVDAAHRIASGFGGGIGQTAGVCGAVAGATMVIGLASCGSDSRSLTSKARVYGVVRSFLEQFEAEHGATSCRELLGCDISTADGRTQAQELGLFETRCSVYVEDAVEILEVLFQENTW